MTLLFIAVERSFERHEFLTTEFPDAVESYPRFCVLDYLRNAIGNIVSRIEIEAACPVGASDALAVSTGINEEVNLFVDARGLEVINGVIGVEAEEVSNRRIDKNCDYQQNDPDAATRNAGLVP